MSRVTRGRYRPYKGQAPHHTIPAEITEQWGRQQDVKLRIKRNSLTYVLKSARLITGTQIVKATYRLEGLANAKSK